MINAACKLYNKLVNIYASQYSKFSEDLKKRVNDLNKTKILILDFNFDEGEDVLPPMPPLDEYEEVKLEPEETTAERIKLNPRKRKNTGTRLKILSPNQLLTRLPILLAQIKAGKNPYKLKNEVRKIQYLLYQHDKIIKKV